MRLHRWLLLLYPKSFRHEYGEELRRVFARRRRDAQGPFDIAGLWIAEIADTLSNAARTHAEIVRQDMRYTWRALRRAPGFFAAATIVTALGIGATTAAFTLTDHVLLRPLPFANPDRLVKIWQGETDRPASMRGLQGTNDVSPANYRDWKAMSSAFDGMGAYSSAGSNLVGAGEPERLSGANLTSEVLAVIGATPALGRTLLESDDRPGAACVVLVSDGLWRRKFGADPSILGRTIVLDDEPCAVAGVMPRGFDFPDRDAAFWRPIRFARDVYEDRNNTYLRVIARLKPGLSREQAGADLSRVSATLARMYPQDNQTVGAVAMPLREEVSEQARLLLFALAGAAACVLLIACTNLASLLLTRATAHAHELAVRAALGAGRERLVRQLLTESLVIAAAGGSIGVGLAFLAVPIAARLVPTGLPIAETPPADLRMLAIAAVATLVTGVVCGVLPAMRASRRADAGALRDGARAGASRRTERIRAGLVIAQVTASVALLVCAGLLLRALWRVQDTDPGFKTDGVLTMRLNLPWSKYGPQSARAQLYRRVIEEAEALPDVAGAAFVSDLPLTRRGGVWGVYLPGQPLDVGAEAQTALVRYVTPGYFDVMGIPLVGGRPFDDRDALKGEQTAIVSETFGRQLWPDKLPLGRHFTLMRTDRTIVGIVGEVKLRGLEGRDEPQLYLPYSQQPDNSFMGYTPRDLAVRMTGARPGAEAALTSAIRQIVAKADPQLPISDVRPLSGVVESDTAARAVQARVLVAFAAVACVLAAIGLHGLLSFVVSTRTRDIGVRVALGARRRDILAMILLRGLKLAAAGAAVGIAVAYVAGRFVQSILAGIDPADTLTIAAAVLLSVLMTLAGSFFPALGAARTDAKRALSN
jgi:predicted permease